MSIAIAIIKTYQLAGFGLIVPWVAVAIAEGRLSLSQGLTAIFHGMMIWPYLVYMEYRSQEVNPSEQEPNP